jgi:iron complex outermembrane receptor protein
LLPTGFVDFSGGWKKFYVSAGVSGTLSKQFGNFGSGGIDMAYHFTDDIKLFASANTAVRLPTFTDLYYKSATQRANPDLKPEKSETFELGATAASGNFKISTSAFYRIGKDIIDWVKPMHPDSIIWESRNFTNLNTFGAEISTNYRFKKSFFRSISLSYSFLEMDKSAKNFDSKYALDYMKHKLIFNLQHNIINRLSAHWTAGGFDRAGNYSDFVTGASTEFKAYFILDFRLQWQAEKYSVYCNINNLSNTKYSDYTGLTQPGRNFTAGVRLRIE